MENKHFLEVKLLHLVDLIIEHGKDSEIGARSVRDLIEIQKEYYSDTCPSCGCTEMLCGHNGPGCISNNKQGE